VTTSKIANGAINSSKLGVDAVSGGSILDLSIQSNDLAANSVTGGKIANGAVDTAQLALGAVDSGRLAPGSVTNSKIAALAVDTAQIANGAVGTTQLAAGAVTGSKIAGNSIDGAQIIDNSIGMLDLKLDSVDGARIKDGTLTAQDVAAQGITGPLVGTFSYDPPSLAANTCQDETQTLSGVVGGDHVLLNLASEGITDPVTIEPMLSLHANFIEFRVCNPTEATLDGAPRLYAYLVIR